MVSLISPGARMTYVLPFSLLFPHPKFPSEEVSGEPRSLEDSRVRVDRWHLRVKGQHKPGEVQAWVGGDT